MRRTACRSHPAFRLPDRRHSRHRRRELSKRRRFSCGVPIAGSPYVVIVNRRRSDENRDFLTREPPELHALACFVHGALTALHALGAVYNYRRRNWGDVAAHIMAALYDARSARHHYRTEQIARRRGWSSHVYQERRMPQAIRNQDLKQLKRLG